MPRLVPAALAGIAGTMRVTCQRVHVHGSSRRKPFAYLKNRLTPEAVLLCFVTSSDLDRWFYMMPLHKLKIFIVDSESRPKVTISSAATVVRPKGLYRQVH